MFTRIRTRTKVTPDSRSWTSSALNIHSVVDPDYCVPRAPIREDTAVDTLIVGDYYSGTISDFLPARTNRRNRRTSSANKQGYRRTDKPFRSVDHVKLRAVPHLDELAFMHQRITNDGVCIDDVSKTAMTSAAAFYCARYGYEFVKDTIRDFNPHFSDITFAQHDWDSIVSRFNESFDQLIPASFFSGESLAESSIFKDALLLVLRPKRFVTNFIHDISKSSLSRQTLGNIHSHFKGKVNTSLLNKIRLALWRNDHTILSSVAVRECIGAHLTYQFGVRPAIEDIIRTVSAHNKVETRLKYLSDYAGGYIPLRVREKVSTSFDPGDETSAVVDFVTVPNNFYSVATLSAMARVRSDINQTSKWRAYAEYFGLNKVIGTAWELIPFSFVVDWFTNAQERINDLTRIHLGEGPFYNLRNLGHSVKQVAEFQIKLLPGFDEAENIDLVLPGNPVPCYTLQYSRYTRDNGLPDSSNSANMSRLGLFHGVTGLELLLQKIL